MEQILLVNPRRRKRKKSSHRRRRASASGRRRLKNPRRGRRRSARGYTIGKRKLRRRLMNPRMGLPSVRGITGALLPAVTGAAGAMLLDIGMGYATPYLPDMLKSGWGKVGAQVGGALLLGFIGAKVPFVGRQRALAFSAGALTIIAYNALRPVVADAIGANVKGLSGLADFTDYSLGAYMGNGRLGAYMNPAPLLSAGRTSPIAARQSQMGAYMGGGYSEDMFG